MVNWGDDGQDREPIKAYWNETAIIALIAVVSLLVIFGAMVVVGRVQQ